MSPDAQVAMMPPLSRRQVWQRAHDIQREFFPDCLEHAQPFPIAEMFDYWMVERGFDTGPTDDLSIDEGVTRPMNDNGRPECLLRTDVYELMHDRHPRSVFTAAHECGHGIMHVPYLGSHLRSGREPRLYRRRAIPAFMDPEWQANQFAGALLMPAAAVVAVVRRYGANPYVVARNFKVSRSAAETHLHYMRKEGLIS